MFTCQATGLRSRPGESAAKLVTHIRNRTYTRYNHKTTQDEIVGHGSEIVREITVSKEYYNQVMAQGFTPKVVVEKD
jgi:hypothetical protein